MAKACRANLGKIFKSILGSGGCNIPSHGNVENTSHFPIHVQNGVECLWSKLKKCVKRSGTNDQIDCAIGEFLYRYNLPTIYGRMNYGAKFQHVLMDVKGHNFK